MLLPINCAMLFTWPLQSRAQVMCTPATSRGGTLEAGQESIGEGGGRDLNKAVN